jgi:hypothetical protein
MDLLSLVVEAMQRLLQAGHRFLEELKRETPLVQREIECVGRILFQQLF